MGTEPGLAADVGLRHVLEDGLSILSNDEIDAERRQFVLNDLVELLQDAARGSELLDKPSLLVATADRSAVDAFSLIDRYLRNEGSTALREDLKTSVTAFGVLRNGGSVLPEDSRKVVRFLRQLLTTLERSHTPGLPDEPDDALLSNTRD